MDFPGKNTVTLNEAAVKSLLSEHLAETFIANGLRVLSVRMEGGFSPELRVIITTDPVEPGEVQ